MYGYIYKTTDLKHNKIYIGKHRASEFSPTAYYGSGNIVRRIIADCKNNGGDISERLSVELLDIAETKAELNQKEKFYIAQYDARNPEIGYNFACGGDGGVGGAMFLGHKHSEETRQRYSETRRGSDNANYGNRWHRTPNMKYGDTSGCRNNMWGKHHSEYTKQLIRNHHAGRIAYSNIEQDCVRMICEDEVQYYESLGWVKGNIHKQKIHKCK